MQNQQQMQAPAGVIVMEQRGQGTPLREFEYGLCSCLDTPLTCLLAWCCSCVQYADNRTTFNPQEVFFTNCFVYFCAASCGCGSCIGGSARTSYRKTLGIDGDPCLDCLLHCFCVPCSLTQEYREIKHVKMQVAPGP